MITLVVIIFVIFVIIIITMIIIIICFTLLVDLLHFWSIYYITGRLLHYRSICYITGRLLQYPVDLLHYWSIITLLVDLLHYWSIITLPIDYYITGCNTRPKQRPSVPSISQDNSHGSGRPDEKAEGAKNHWVRIGSLKNLAIRIYNAR